MTHAVETMAYANDIRPWHGLGVEVEQDLTPKEMIIAAGLDWRVHKAKMFAKFGEQTIEVDNNHSLVRVRKDGSADSLGVCGPVYEPYQNEDVFKFFDKFCKAGKMVMKTAGSLQDGRHVWGLAQMKNGFTLGGKDRTDGYILLSHPHVWGKALVIRYTPIQVVCMNTLMMALSQETEHKFRQPHIYAFDNTVIEQAEKVVGMADDKMNEFQSAAEFLASKEFTDKSLNHFIANLMQPDLIVSNDPTDGNNEVVMFEEFKRNAWIVRDAIATQPGANLKARKNTWWGAFNAVTYCVDHEFGNSRDSALQNAWFGPNSRLKTTAYNLALEYATAA